MRNRKVFLRKFQTFIVTGIISVTAVLAVPVFAQEAEAEGEEKSVLIESTISGDVDASKAVTVKDIRIPLDQFQLLVKPLTIEELQIESAAWLLLLKNKVQEISNTEIAIKRKNLAIDDQEDAGKAVEEAKTKLAKAEKELAEASPGTPEYEKATKDLEEAKEALKEMNQAVEKAIETTKENQQDKEFQKTEKEAKVKEEIARSQKILDEAKEERDKLAAGSAAYNAATEKIDALNQAFTDLETEEEKLKSAIPDSEEYKKLSTIVDQARTKVIQAAEIVSKAGLAPSETEDKNSVKPEDTKKELENISSKTDETGKQSQEELEKVTEKLDNVADVQKDLKDQFVIDVTELQGEQTAIIDRFKIILDSVDKKGGDSTSYRKYIDGISGVELNINDTQGLGVRLLSWLKSEEGGIRWGLNMAMFVGIIIASIFVARIAVMLTNFFLKRFSNTSALFRDFIDMLVGRGTIVIGVLLALTSLGVSLGPILALLGGASFILAFALQSNLGNFASGLMLLVNKPFDVGDEVKVAGYWAFVDSISLANTKLKGFDGSIINLPNNTVWGGDIINYTHADIRKHTFTIKIKFEQDLDQIKAMWMEITASHPKVLDTPAPGWFPYNSSFDYYIPVSLNAWTTKEDYWGVYVELLKTLQKRIGELNILLTAPMQDIRIEKTDANMKKIEEITTQTSSLSKQDSAGWDDDGGDGGDDD